MMINNLLILRSPYDLAELGQIIYNEPAATRYENIFLLLNQNLNVKFR